MPSTSEDWNFGPSKPYLRGNKLAVGDQLTIRLVSLEPEDIDTDFGPKVQMVFDVLTSTNSEIPPKVYIWNTECGAAKKLRAFIIEEELDLNKMPNIILEMKEDGLGLKPFRESA